MKKIIKRSTKPLSKLKSQLVDITKATIKLNNKIYKDENIISFSNHNKPDFRLIRKSIAPEWKFYPSCMIFIDGKFGSTRFTLGKKNTIQKKREKEETERLKKSKLKYPKYYNFYFDDDTLTLNFKYEGVFDDIDSGNGEYNVKQAFEIKFERPSDYKKLKECMSDYLEKSGKFHQPVGIESDGGLGE